VIKALRAYTIPILLIILAISQVVQAQVRPVGITWQTPESVTQARAEVEQMRLHGISHVYTSDVPSDELMQVLRNSQIHLFVQQPLLYVTTWHLSQNLPDYKAEIAQNWNRLRSYPFLTGYSLFFEGALHRPDFIGLVSELRPPGMSDQLAFYSSDMDPPSGYSIPMNRLGLVQSMDEAKLLAESSPDLNYLVLVNPSEDQDIGQWYDLLKTKGTGRIYLTSDILFVNSPHNETLLTLIKDIQSDPEYLLPIVPETETEHQDGYSILLFFVIVVIFGIHYAFDPTYRKSLQRFFHSNRIFVDDLVQRRAKLTFSNYIVIMYVTLLSGTFFMSMTEFKVSRSGIELLSYFVPLVSSENALLFGFLAGCVISMLVVAFLIPWGVYMNKGTTHFMSYITIILWPNHVLFIIVVVSIVLARIMNDPYIAAVLALLVIALPVISYSYGGLKLIRYSFRSGLPYLFLYFVPPFLLLASLVWWLVNFTPVIQLAELMIMLP
jgi:hypothetical protein